MKLQLSNVYLIEKKLLRSGGTDKVKIAFEPPHKIQNNLFGWNVYIRSHTHNLDNTKSLMTETISQFQFSSETDYAREFRHKKHLDHFSNLVYTAHCQHAALSIHSAVSYPSFEAQLPPFVGTEDAKKLTSVVMNR